MNILRQLKRMCKICKNEYNNSNTVYICNCKKIVQVPLISDIKRVHISNCPNLISIFNINNIHDLYLERCNSIVTVPKINTMQILFINSCNNLKKIDFCDGISNITISNCKNFIDFKTSYRIDLPNKKLIRWLSNSYHNTEFKMICKIKTWYKNITNKYRLKLKNIHKILYQDVINELEYYPGLGIKYFEAQNEFYKHL